MKNLLLKADDFKVVIKLRKEMQEKTLKGFFLRCLAAILQLATMGLVVSIVMLIAIQILKLFI